MKSTPDVGICGNASPNVSVNGEDQGPAGICELPAGHAGWHRGPNTNGGWGAPSYGSWGVLGAALMTSATTAAVDIDLALAKIAALLPSNHDNVDPAPTLASALEALAAYLAAGGELKPLPGLGQPFERTMRGILRAFHTAGIDIDAANRRSVDGLRKVGQINEISTILRDQFARGNLASAGVRYDIAEALWDAGYRKTETPTTDAGDPE